MKKKQIGILGAAGAVLILIIVFIAWEKEPSFVEKERLEAFERHSAICERARRDFEWYYSQLPRGTRTPEAIAEVLDLEEPLELVPRANGEQEAVVELPDKYSRVIIIWDDDGKPTGFTWKIDTPASDNVAWAKHLESYEI